MSPDDLMDDLESQSREERAEQLFMQLPDPGAREELVELFYPLAESLSRRFQGYGEPFDDLLQVASIGLLKAVDRFDVDRGVRFATYATPTIIGELKRYFRDKGWAVRVPRRLQENALRLRDTVQELSQEHGRSPTIEEISERTAMDSDEILEAMDALDAYSGISLDAPVEEEGRSTLERLGEDDSALDVAEGWADLEPYLQALPERERRIIYLRFFRGWTQSRIADDLGISQMHVSRLLARTLKQLRQAVSDGERGR